MVDKKKPSPAQPSSELTNEGEGSRSGARSYDAGAEKMARSGKVEDLAKKAEQALEGKEGEELRRAEEQGKKGQLPRPR